MEISNSPRPNALQRAPRRKADALVSHHTGPNRFVSAVLTRYSRLGQVSSVTSPLDNDGRRSHWRLVDVWISAAQMGPTVLLMLLFLLAPLAVMLGMSFFRSTIFGMESLPSLVNYEKLFSDPLYGLLLLKSLRIAMTVTAVVLLISFPVSYWRRYTYLDL